MQEGREEEGWGCRQTENLHRYPMKDNRAFAIAFDGGREGETGIILQKPRQSINHIRGCKMRMYLAFRAGLQYTYYTGIWWAVHFDFEKEIIHMSLLLGCCLTC